jgi:hypothetical protein
MAPLLPAGPLAAGSVTVRVQVTFVDPVAVSEVSALQFGSLSQSLADKESVTVASTGTVSDPADHVMGDPADHVMGGAKTVVRGAPQAAANLLVRAPPRQSITILVDGASPGAGYSLTDFRCSYGWRE